MIVSIDIADVRPRQALRVLAKRPRPERIAGLRYAETVIAAPLSRGPSKPSIGTVALIAA